MTFGQSKGYHSTPVHLARTTFQRHQVPTTLTVGSWVFNGGQLRRRGDGAYCMSQSWMMRTEKIHLSVIQTDYIPAHPISGLGFDLGLCKAGSSAWKEAWRVAQFRAGPPQGQLRQRWVQTFAVTQHTGTAHSCAVAGNSTVGL